MKIYHYPHETLKQVSVPCDPTDYKDEFEEQMKKLMVESNGIGLICKSNRNDTKIFLYRTQILYAF